MISTLWKERGKKGWGRKGRGGRGNPQTVTGDINLKDASISQLTAISQLLRNLLRTTALRSQWRWSSLIMEISLSSNKAEDHFTIYHMDFIHNDGPIITHTFLKAFQLWSSVSSSMKKYIHFIQLWRLETIYINLLAQQSCRVSSTTICFKYTIKLYYKHLLKKWKKQDLS